MYRSNAQGNSRTKLLASAVLVVIGMSGASVAMSTDVFGGGATLPAGAYVGFNFIGAGNARLSQNTTANTYSTGATAPTAGSLFGAWSASSGNKISYCQTGSGNGKKVFDHSDGTVSTLTSVGVCDGTTAGFGAPTGVAVDPYFAASDAPMSAAEYGWFTSPGGKGTTYGQPVQFPAVVGSVAIVFNNPDATGTINMTDAQVCGVFNGSINNWSTFGLPSRAIKVVYRSDGSGTTFSLANHLATACAGTASQHFVADQAFTTVVSKYTLPSTWVGVSGNPAIISSVNSTAGTIGYAESANLKAVASSAPSVKYATVNGLDPYANLAASLNLQVSYNEVISGADATTGKPVIATQTPAVAGTTCLGLVEPSKYAAPTSGYPIIAVSNLIANYKGNGAALASVQSLLAAPYVSGHPGVTTIGANTGYAFVNPAPAINAAKISACTLN